MGGRLRENCNNQSGTVKGHKGDNKSLCGINCEVLSNSSSLTTVLVRLCRRCDAIMRQSNQKWNDAFTVER